MERRKFIKNSALGLGAGSVLASSALAVNNVQTEESVNNKSLREVWIATFSLNKVKAESHIEMVDKVLIYMEEVVNYSPDIICLPELFPYFHITEKISIKDVAEKTLGKITSRFADFAKKYKTYIICPLYTVDNGKYYNSAVVIDREGRVLGEYRKIHPTIDEMDEGITPAPMDPPVFQTDFGKIGVQICFDLEWDDGWKILKEKGAEIVFYCSAYSGGKAVNTRAWQNKYCVVSSVIGGSSKICDVTGEVVAQTGRWEKYWAIAPLNLEKAFLHTWPFNKKFKDIHTKYGRKIKITNFDEEEWSIIESLSPDIKVTDILKEFDLKTHTEHIKTTTVMQEKQRSKIQR